MPSVSQWSMLVVVVVIAWQAGLHVSTIILTPISPLLPSEQFETKYSDVQVSVDPVSVNTISANTISANTISAEDESFIVSPFAPPKLQQFLSDEDVPGMIVIQFVSDASSQTPPDESQPEDLVSFDVWWDGNRQKKASNSYSISKNKILTYNHGSILKLLGIKSNRINANPKNNEPEMFTYYGDHVTSGLHLLKLLSNPPKSHTLNPSSQHHNIAIYFIMTGGVFIFPGVRVGHVTLIQHVDDYPQGVQMTTLAMKPLVFAIEKFLSDAESEHIINVADYRMAPSPVSHADIDRGKPSTTWRTSTQTYLSLRQDDVIANIERRTHQVLKIPESHGEPMQVLRYELTQKYDPHHDYFNPVLYQTQPHMLEMVQDGAKNRLATFFWYMSDVEKGGETGFPRAGGKPPVINYEKSCTEGLTVRPKKGNAVLFYSMLPSGELDEYSLHGGCKVLEGKKWAVNKWVWNKPYYD